MSKIIQRKANNSDIEGIAQLISESWKSFGPKSEMHIGDLYWACFNKKIDFQDLNPLVWQTPQGSIVAFSMVSKGGWCDLVVHPDLAASNFIPQAVASAEEHIRNRSGCLRFGRRIFNKEVESALLAMGFTRMNSGYPTLHLTLDGTTQEETRDDGISIGAGAEFSPTQRAEAWNDAFPADSRTEADMTTLMAARGYREDLDFTCWTNDGTVAAFCTVWLDEQTKTALFEPVGTRPDFQRRGLARLLVRTAANRLHTIGGRSACVRVYSENRAAKEFYLAVGFQQASFDFGFEKQRNGVI